MMPLTTTQLLKEVPGLPRDYLYFWQKRDWIRPRKEGARLVWPEEEVRKIQLLWKHYQAVLRPQKAYEAAVAELKRGKR